MNTKFRSVWTKLWDSRRFQWSKYIAFDDESDVQAQNMQFQRPETKKYETPA